MGLQGVPTDSELVKENRFITTRWLDWFNRLPVAEVIQDTRAHRSQYPPSANKNRTYRETDTGLTYVSTGTAWIYFFGEYPRTQSQIATLVATLAVNDAGLLINVTDFKHKLKWDGAALDFASGDDGSNYFIDAPSAPLGKIVQLCDGTATTYLKADGTTGSYTTKNLTGHHRKSVTSGADATVAAVAPGFSGASAAEAAHTHAVTSPTGTPSATTSVDNTGAGSTTTVGSATHTHTVTSPTGAGSSHTHGAGSYAVDATGEPAVYKALTYFRR